MDPQHYRGLAFLLSLGSLPVACKPDGGGTTSDSGGSGSSGTGGPTTGPDTATSGGTGTEATGPTTSAGTGTQGTGATDTGSPGSLCEAVAEHGVTCDPMVDPAEALATCEAARKMYEQLNGPTCLLVYDALLECESQAACDDPDPCPAELEAILSCKPEPGPICEAYGAKYVECAPPGLPYGADYFAGYCQAYINFGLYMSGQPCGSALEELQSCLSMLPCADIEMGTGCEAQQMAVDMNCDFGERPPSGPRPARAPR